MNALRKGMEKSKTGGGHEVIWLAGGETCEGAF